MFTQVVPFPWARTPNIVRDYRVALEKVAPKAEPSFSSLEGYINARVLTLALNLPRQALAERLPQSARFAGTKLAASQPLQGITLAFFDSLFKASGTTTLHPPTSLRIAGHAMDLLGIALADVIESRPNPSPYRAALLRRDGQSQLVYKHAISTVMPMGPIQLQDEPAEH